MVVNTQFHKFYGRSFARVLSLILMKFLYFLGYLDLKGSHISSGKKTKIKNIRKGLGRRTLNTCAKFQGLSLKNGMDIWTFVR